MRKTLSLDGVWTFRPDKKDEGEWRDWHVEGVPGGYEVKVPHIWQRDGEELVTYNGAAWYEKRFPFKETEGRIFLQFQAVDYHTKVWLNGQYIGEHEGGFTPFEFDISKVLLQDEENVLTVRVFDPEDNAEIPIGKQGSWYTRVSGIWQSVGIERRPDTFIESVKVIPDPDKEQLKVKLKVNGKLSRNAEALFTVCNHLSTDLAVISQKEFLTSNDIEYILNIPNPVLWELENPHLYDLEVAIGEDSMTCTFGMRKISFEDGRITLNNKPVYIRGALDQAFYPDTIYVAPSDEYIQKEIRLAKQMGFNMLRKHIKVEIPRYLYWADRMGILIWAEPPNYVKFTPQATKRFTDELTAMIKRDFNHPSIIIWSIYNEEWGLEWDLANDPVKQKHVEEMYDSIKMLDPTRLICDNSGWTHVKTDINDHHRYFVCPDQLISWKKDLDEFVIGDPDKNFVDGYESKGEPIIVSEFGVWGLPSVEKLKEHYEGVPWWFINQGEESHQEDYKKPTTYLENFTKYQLDETFGSFENLAVASQNRMFRAVKSVIEEMRKRPSIAGYVVTEFTDIEWETNGWLDYLRNPKEGFERLIDFNGPITVLIDKMANNVWSGEMVDLDIIVCNDHLRPFEGAVEWSITGTQLSGSIPVNSSGEAITRLNDPISFQVPEVTLPGFHQLELLLKTTGGQTLATNKEEMTITPRIKRSKGEISVYALNKQILTELDLNGYETIDYLDENLTVITDTLDEEILNFVHKGGKVVFLAEEGDRIENKGHYTFRELPEGESWPRASSFNFVNPNHFPGIPLHPEMGWEVDLLIPDYVVPFSDYKKPGSRRSINMFGSPGIARSSRVISGYFQGWVGQVGGSLIVQRCGKGTITLTTWKLKENYGTHPIATQVLDRLISMETKDLFIKETTATV
ncbi:glycoside hydrolase family 2 protein [Mesobacillus foraminis]|uniref:Glycosyl hydrolase family 2 n=1 Tax=Mesobacillus foraminis TaxID=279826 RepID=A0A4R2B3E9_9BACI|nr:glycoside hydrolase family 2 TIM barrel-domain containing protein [Mesobacillus foraminis]TCN21138.1 glycosyl hydrolase family 2 [Mesobacillus foraminis]